MKKRDFADMVIYFCQKVSEMNISEKNKIELLGMIIAIETKHDELMQKWIPVTEALPEEREWLGTKRFSDVVYVTFENPKGERFCKHLRFQNGKLSGYDQSAIDAFYPEAKPIAWMPLPEPAKIGDGK